MRRRIIALVAALLLAGAGTFVLVGFVRGAADRATAGEEQVTVYVLQSAVPQGTAGGVIGEYVLAEEVPSKVRSADAITDVADLEGLVADVSLVPGEILLASRFVLPSETDNRRDDLPDRRVEVPAGKLELPVRFSAEQALGGIIDAGDTVAIIASFDAYSVAGEGIVEVAGGVEIAIPETADGSRTQSVQATDILINSVLVVEVQADSTPNFTASEEEDGGGAVLAPSTSFIITFALDPADAARVVFAAEYGKLWLASQTPDDDGPTELVTIDDIFTR